MPRRPSITGRDPAPGVFAAQARPWTGGTVVELRGELDVDSAGELRTALDTLLAAAPVTVIVLDCACLEFCDSTGLNTMLRAQTRAVAQGSRIELARPRPLVLRMLELTGATEAFPIRDTLPQ
ncbi:STAS domain-containing protein [Kitasatospora sp. NPDC048722]|uniref:STAS domain-containing protein n=1 Tax=Kitasatospora sp. NPDC048722 TaxID=3155639 RepID=UPI0033D0931B